MILTILPKAPSATEAVAAQAKLQTLIDDVETVVLIAYGDAEGTDRAIEIAVGRANVPPNIRQVVWCPNPDVLSPEQKQNYWRKDAAVVTVGLADKIAATLSLARAQMPLQVELAFSKAEAQAKV